MNITILYKTLRLRQCGIPKYQHIRQCSSKVEELELPKNLLEDVYSASKQSKNGRVYDNKPFKTRCEAGKTYSWCLCGYSKSQPYCDGTHRHPHIKITQRPVRFSVAKTQDYWLCNCKQTSNRPFCDGSHKEIDLTQYKK